MDNWTMDLFVDVLHVARDLEKESSTRASAYFAYIDACRHGLNLIYSRHSIQQNPRDCLNIETVKIICDLGLKSVGRAIDLLPFVIDLSDSERKRASNYNNSMKIADKKSSNVIESISKALPKTPYDNFSHDSRQILDSKNCPFSVDELGDENIRDQDDSSALRPWVPPTIKPIPMGYGSRVAESPMVKTNEVLGPNAAVSTRRQQVGDTTSSPESFVPDLQKLTPMSFVTSNTFLSEISDKKSVEKLNDCKKVKDRIVNHYQVDPDAPIPMIPTSSLNIGYCRQMFVMKKYFYEVERLFTRKSWFNAIFLRKLESIMQSMERACVAKAQIAASMRLIRTWRIFDIPALEIAQQLTLIQMYYFERIDRVEFSILNGDSRPDTQSVTYHMNEFQIYVRQWCVIEVLRYSDVGDRSKVLVLMIKVARNLQEMGNFDMAHTITRALGSEPVTKASDGLRILPQTFQNQMESLTLLFGRERSWAHLRSALEARRGMPTVPVIRNSYVCKNGPDLRDLRIDEKTVLKWSKSAYRELFEPRYVIQHYILTQPFRWDSELIHDGESGSKESGVEADGDHTTSGQSVKLSSVPDQIEKIKYKDNSYQMGGKQILREVPDDRIFPDDVARMSTPHDDTYHVIKRQIDRISS